jgi:hypothetical protein
MRYNQMLSTESNTSVKRFEAAVYFQTGCVQRQLQHSLRLDMIGSFWEHH